ncbi:MAG: Single-stranded DNA binding protein, partial [Methanosarcinales archaeon]
RSGSGLIRRCPDCSRVIQNNICRVHGEVAPVTDMRVKSVIDDGTGSIMLVLSSELTETLWGHTLREAEEMASKRAPDSVERDIRESLTGKRITARGNMNNGEYGASLVAESVSFVKRDVREEAIKLLKEWGVHENA